MKRKIDEDSNIIEDANILLEIKKVKVSNDMFIENLILQDQLSSNKSLDINNNYIQYLSNINEKELEKNINLLLSFLTHCLKCTDSFCPYIKCKLLKNYFNHQTYCFQIDCVTCKKINILFKVHKNRCIDMDCKIPFCKKCFF
jgi:hypothetical protein